jgi:hypothetical protein
VNGFVLGVVAVMVGTTVNDAIHFKTTVTGDDATALSGTI